MPVIKAQIEDSPSKFHMPIEEAPVQPQLPTLLEQELESKPNNYNSLGPLSREDIFEACLQKWTELGALTTQDIIKNSSLPINFNLAVS